MFWDKWIPKKYLVKSDVCAIEACFSSESVIFYYSHLRNKNNKLVLVSAGSCIHLNELPVVVVKNKIPVILIINGHGTILKKITLPAVGDASGVDEIVRQNLPAVNASEFYIQLYQSGEAAAYLALCRKEQANGLLTQLTDKKIEVATVNIGAPAINGLQPLWQTFNILPTSLHDVELGNNNIEAIKPVPELNNGKEVTVAGINIKATHTLGFASGLSYFMQQPLHTSTNTELLALPAVHSNKNKFHFLLVLVVGVAFILAVGNVIFFTTYYDKNNKLESELSAYQGKYEKINQLLTDYQKNKDLIEGAGVLNRNKLSEYADRIGLTLPEEVVLTELHFNPKMENEDGTDSLVTFDNRHIILKGNCNKSLIINEWVNVLKMQRFVKEVSLEKFTYNSDGLLPNFEIKILTE